MGLAGELDGAKGYFHYISLVQLPLAVAACAVAFGYAVTLMYALPLLLHGCGNTCVGNAAAGAVTIICTAA